MKGEFYKMDFRAWNVGTVDLTLEQEGAYLRLCHAMYDVGGPVPNSTRFLQSIFRCGNTKAVTLVSQLIAAGKIGVTGDGRLINHRVTEELAARERVSAARRVAGERGGSAPRANAERPPSDPRATSERLPTDGRATPDKSLKNHESHEAIASTLRSRGEERRGDKEDASHLPERKRSKPNILCPEDLQPSDKHYAKAAERGFDRAFVGRVRDRMFRWSHSNAKRAVARKTDWNLALFDFLEKAMDEADERPKRGAPPTKSADFWAAEAIDANAELTGGRYDNRPFNRDAEQRHRPGEPGGVRSYEPAAQQAGADPWGVATLRLVGGGRA